jgi:hypothetical protein
MGIRVADLFDRDSVAPDKRREVLRLRENEMVAERRQRRRRVVLMECYRAASRRMEEIAKLLSAGDCADEAALGKEFHDALEFQRRVELEVIG